MRKFAAAAVLLALAIPVFGSSGAHAANATTCVTDGTTGAVLEGDGPSTELHCSFAAKGTVTVVWATPNQFQVIVHHPDNTSDVGLAHSSLTPPNTATVTAAVGDTIEIILGNASDPDCVQAPICGTIGLVAAKNN